MNKPTYEELEARNRRLANKIVRMGDEFQETLRAEIRKAKEAAWDEGYTSGHSRAMRYMSDEPNVAPASNPYRDS